MKMSNNSQDSAIEIVPFFVYKVNDFFLYRGVPMFLTIFFKLVNET